MSDYILNHRREIPRDRLSEMHQDDAGTPTLEIKLHYSKDGRPRGLKLSVYRCLAGDGFASYDIMNRHNGLIHIADFSRKPSAKVAAQWESIVRAKLDAIAEIALASDTPDWPAVRAMFASVDA